MQDSVRTLKAKACAAVGALPSAVLLWDAYDADDLQPLEQQLGSSLADANIVQGQALLLELRKPRRREWQVGVRMINNTSYTCGVHRVHSITFMHLGDGVRNAAWQAPPSNVHHVVAERSCPAESAALWTSCTIYAAPAGRAYQQAAIT